jgi:hypothetical protein
MPIQIKMYTGTAMQVEVPNSQAREYPLPNAALGARAQGSIPARGNMFLGVSTKGMRRALGKFLYITVPGT